MITNYVCHQLNAKAIIKTELIAEPFMKIMDECLYRKIPQVRARKKTRNIMTAWKFRYRQMVFQFTTNVLQKHMLPIWNINILHGCMHTYHDSSYQEFVIGLIKEARDCASVCRSRRAKMKNILLSWYINLVQPL